MRQAAPSLRCARGFAGALAPGGSADAALLREAREYLWPKNVVATVWLATSVDLREFSASRAFAHIPPKFWACVVRLMTKRVTTILLFPTGSAVIVGARCIEQSIAAAQMLRLILSATRRTRFARFRFVNSVYSGKAEDEDVGIDIAAIHRDMQEWTVYEPIRFPGMKVNMQDEDCKSRLFDKGGMIMMGVKHPVRVPRIVSTLNNLARMCPDRDVPVPSKRFRYRQDKKRAALVDIVARKMGADTETETETDGDER